MIPKKAGIILRTVVSYSSEEVVGLTDVFDYIRWRGDLTFRQDPPNEVDALVFSALAYIRYCGQLEDGINSVRLLRDAYQDFLSFEGSNLRVRVKRDLELFKAAAQSVRFGECALCMYMERFIPEEETQFAAVTFLLDDGSAFLAFRGTDDTLVGWKEDFNMSFQQTVPAQRLALEYTELFASIHLMPLRLGGHSKGGNLAVYAGAGVSPDIQKRILEVYNNDGPGFSEDFITDSGYLRIVPKIKTFVPQSSVIGMLLEHEEPYIVIRSNQVSLLQHEIYSWEVIGKRFVEMESITADSRFLDLTIKNWIAEMTPQERNILVDALYDLLSSGEVDSALDIFRLKNIRHYLKALSTNGNMRKLFSDELRSLVAAAKKATEQFTLPEQAEEQKSLTE